MESTYNLYQKHGSHPVQSGELAHLLDNPDTQDPTDLYRLGRTYINGEAGQETDTEKGLAYIRRAAGLGHPRAQYHLFKMWYIQGWKTKTRPTYESVRDAYIALGKIHKVDNTLKGPCRYWQHILRDNFPYYFVMLSKYIPELKSEKNPLAPLMDAALAGFTPAMTLYARILIKNAADIGDEDAKNLHAHITEARKPKASWQPVPEPTHTN